MQYPLRLAALLSLIFLLAACSSPSPGGPDRDTQPNAFSFENRAGVEPDTLVTSNSITVSGINAPAPISTSAGTLIIDGEASNADTVTNGQTVAVRLRSSPNFDTSVSATVTIGGVSSTFRVTTRTAPAPDPEPEEGSLKWVFQDLEDPPMFYRRSRPALGHDGTIYYSGYDIGDNFINDHFFAVNPDGTLKWSYATEADAPAAPAIAEDGTIYVFTGARTGDKLLAFNPNGTVKWTFDDFSRWEGRLDNPSPSIGADGTIYFTAGDLYALNPDGTLKWQKEVTIEAGSGSTEIRVDNEIVIGNNGTLYTYAAGGLIALDAAGDYLWHVDAPIGFVDTIPAVALGTDAIYIKTTRTIKKVLLDAQGNVQEESSFYNFPLALGNHMSIDADGNVYIVSGNFLYALDSNGNRKWFTEIAPTDTTPSEFTIDRAPVLGADGTIYVNGSTERDDDFGISKPTLYAFDSLGNLLWTKLDYAANDMLIAQDGTLYLRDGDGLVLHPGRTEG